MKKEVKVVRTEDIMAVTPYQSEVKGYSARRLVTKKRMGSEKLMVGIVEIEPNAKGYRWSYSEAEGNDEVYYVLQGKIRLSYEERFIDARKGDAIFLPAGREYRLDNRQSRPARLIYALSPPIE
jgi:mannose-6-phosphate isomerase-like protein (cupin superfamily)